MFIAVALIIVALLYYVADSIITSTVDLWIKILYLIGLIFVIGFVIWAFTLLLPKLFQKVSQIIKADSLEAKETSLDKVVSVKSEHTKKQVPIKQEAISVYEESESEKLLREFKNRRL